MTMGTVRKLEMTAWRAYRAGKWRGSAQDEALVFLGALKAKMTKKRG
jgi:hypothetical protein